MTVWNNDEKFLLKLSNISTDMCRFCVSLRSESLTAVRTNPKSDIAKTLARIEFCNTPILRSGFVRQENCCLSVLVWNSTFRQRERWKLQNYTRCKRETVIQKLPSSLLPPLLITGSRITAESTPSFSRHSCYSTGHSHVWKRCHFFYHFWHRLDLVPSFVYGSTMFASMGTNQGHLCGTLQWQ